VLVSQRGLGREGGKESAVRKCVRNGLRQGAIQCLGCKKASDGVRVLQRSTQRIGTCPKTARENGILLIERKKYVDIGRLGGHLPAGNLLRLTGIRKQGRWGIRKSYVLGEMKSQRRGNGSK